MVDYPVYVCFFSGMEVAFISSDKLRYAVQKKSTGLYNRMLNSIYENPHEFLGSLMVGKVIVIVVFVYLSFLIFTIRSLFGLKMICL